MDNAQDYYSNATNSKPVASGFDPTTQGYFQVMAGVRVGFDVLKGWK